MELTTRGFPTEWSVLTVGQIAARQRNAVVGGPFGSDLVSNDYVTSGVPVIRGQNMGGRWVSGQFVFVTDEKARALSSNLARPADIVVTQRGTLGQVSLVPEGQYDRYVISQSQMKVTVDPEVADPLFCYHVLTSDPLQEHIQKSTIQTGVPHINLGILRQIPIPVPPLGEQRAIAAALSEVDDLVAALDAVIEKKRAVKTAAMQRLLTGRQRLPGFSGEWETRRLGEIATLGGGMSASRAQLSSEGHRYLHYGDIHVTDRTHAHVHEHYDNRPRLDIPLGKAKSSSLLQDGDVVFVDASEDEEGASRYVVVDNPTGIPFISGLHTIVAKGLTTRFDPLYMRYAFQAPVVKDQIRFYAVGTKVMGVSKSNLAKIEVPIPPRKEQEAIAAILTDMDAEVAALEARREKTRLIKQGMMQELLTGRTRLV